MRPKQQLVWVVYEPSFYSPGQSVRAICDTEPFAEQLKTALSKSLPEGRMLAVVSFPILVGSEEE